MSTVSTLDVDPVSVRESFGHFVMEHLVLIHDFVPYYDQTKDPLDWNLSGQPKGVAKGNHDA